MQIDLADPGRAELVVALIDVRQRRAVAAIGAEPSSYGRVEAFRVEAAARELLTALSDPDHDVARLVAERHQEPA